ncbi:MAG: fimbrillin family protein [Alistipes sp.]|nr:fimbrillin family protein [Alistipes sp.]
MFRNSLFIIAFCGLFASCSRQDLELRSSDASVIRLGVAKIGTRTVVNDLDDLAKEGGNVGIYGVEVATATPTPGDGWGNTLSMDNVRTTGIDAANGAISWTGVYYYPLDHSHFVKFCAYYPYADQSNGFSVVAPAAGKAPVLNLKLDGTQDVMFAAPVTGNRTTAPAALRFEHALTQLHFKIEDVNKDLKDYEIRNIVFQEANTVSTMNIETGELGEWSDPIEVEVPGIKGEGIIFDGGDSHSMAVGEPVMLQPGLESFKLRVETSGGTYSDVVIKPTAAIPAVFEAGRSYEITLLVDEQVEILVSVAVKDWIFGGTGSVIIK